MSRKIRIRYALPLGIVIMLAGVIGVTRNSGVEAATAGGTLTKQSAASPQFRINNRVASGEAKQRYFARVVDGQTWSLVRFVNELGQICAGERRTTAAGDWGQGLSCRDPGTLFEREPLTYFVGSQRESDTSPTWDNAWVWGWAAPNVRGLNLIMSDCSRVSLVVNFERLFFHVIGSASLRAGVAPLRLEAYDASGARIADKPAPLLDPATGTGRTSTTCS